jgi:hypothetical protein
MAATDVIVYLKVRIRHDDSSIKYQYLTSFHFFFPLTYLKIQPTD